MFILVSTPFGFFTGGLSGSQWRTFESWSGLTQSLLYITLISPWKFQKFLKYCFISATFFLEQLHFMLIELALKVFSSRTDCTKLTVWVDFVSCTWLYCTNTTVFCFGQQMLDIFQLLEEAHVIYPHFLPLIEKQQASFSK